MGTIISWWLNALLQWAGCVLISAPVVFLSAWQSGRLGTSTIPWRRLAGLAAFLLVALGLARSNVDWVFWRAPWQGMLLEAIFALGVILAMRSLAQSGVTTPITANGWRGSLWMTAGLLGFVTLRTLLTRWFQVGSDATPYPEYLLYELSMPGIAEELAYRGVIQSQFNAWLGKPWKVLGTPVGWGWLITAVVFWAMHAFSVSSPQQITFYWPTLTHQLFIGLGLGWIREKSGSIVPAILAHNLVNVLRVIL
jgi:uncharacterized protein